jgi:hypothetical protein
MTTMPPTDISQILAPEVARRAHFGQPAMTQMEQLAYVAEQTLPCLYCEQWQSSKARALIGAVALGLVTREQAVTLFQRGLCCRGEQATIITYQPPESIPRSEEVNGRRSWW